MDQQQQLAARKARAAARTEKLAGQVVSPHQPKPSPYRDCSPEERLKAAVRLIGYHEELRGSLPRLPRSQWPGETFLCPGDGG